VEDLAADVGLIGIALANLPAHLRAQADQQPNPWVYLLEVGLQLGIPESELLTFRAAASQREALLRFARMVQKTGTVNSSVYDRLVAARQANRPNEQAMLEQKIFAGMYRMDRGQWIIRAAEPHPEIHRRLILWASSAATRSARRLGAQKSEAIPNRPTIADCTRGYVASDRIAFAMATPWLRGDLCGFPGFCFCSDVVIATLLRRILNLPTSLDVQLIRKIRQRIGLIKARVVVLAIQPLSQNEFELRDANGKSVWRGGLIDPHGEPLPSPARSFGRST
jgi:hypothetical protein